MKGAIKKQKIKRRAWLLRTTTIRKPSNPEIHALTTGPELEQFEGKQIDAFLAGVGTGGTLSGVGKVLKENILMLKSLL